MQHKGRFWTMFPMPCLRIDKDKNKPIPAPQIPVRKPTLSVYLFLDCLYVKRLRVLNPRKQVSFFPDHSPAMYNIREENMNIRNIFSQFPPHHLLGNQNILVILPVMHCEPQTDEVGQDSGGSFLGFDRWCTRGRGHLSREREAIGSSD